jgi:hypothetical protein
MEVDRAVGKVPAAEGDGQRIVVEGVCSQLGIKNLDVLREAKFLTLDGEQTILDGGLSDVTSTDHGLYLEFQKSALKTPVVDNGPAARAITTCCALRKILSSISS